MGTSAFDPVALADVRSVRSKINMSGLTDDVLGVGDVIRYDPNEDKYLLAQADNETNAAFFGVIETVNGGDFTVVYSGEISLPDSLMTTISGSTGAQIFYLSDTNRGKLTTTAPSNPGSVIKPVIITTGDVLDAGIQGAIDGVVVNGTGTRISGDSTVDLSDIQPVGSISAFAGNTGSIPSGWDICDGGLLSVTAFSDLYTSLNSGRLYGFVQQVTLTLVPGSNPITQGNLIGSFFFVSKPGLTDNFKCTFLSGTVSGSSINSAEVLVEPLTTDSNNPVYHDQELALNDLTGSLYLASGTQQNTFYKISSSSNPKTQFRKPDLRARFLLGSSKGITGMQPTGFSVYDLGKAGGEETHVLTSAEIPTHSHTPTTTINLATSSSGSHTHRIRTSHFGNVSHGHNDDTQRGDYDQGKAQAQGIGNADPSFKISFIETSGSHTHAITGNVNVAIANVGGNQAHNNVPQHVVVYWIIKTRKDSYARIFRLGPSGGGAIIAKNTAKRWARASSGAGCTVDISYGNWGVARLGTGHYEFYHDLISELGTADQTKYIVEVAVNKGTSGATQMFLANPYGYQGMTFGVRVYDILGATFSDNFQFINLTVYGGGTAL